MVGFVITAAAVVMAAAVNVGIIGLTTTRILFAGIVLVGIVTAGIVLTGVFTAAAAAGSDILLQI